eukprot:CAMPEP_0115344756 /NCGR_PEP_ID=MMETSP0270-20121206/93453_1 /TAXON_ID=71861 /ORGANISM="Scrippsiella trochoidea, Strain CCMP3099" /LENGTH=48 /DNA_ID= /DNA_START= /DNA_END= /DNA_ORIENTATION=
MAAVGSSMARGISGLAMLVSSVCVGRTIASSAVTTLCASQAAAAAAAA